MKKLISLTMAIALCAALLTGCRNQPMDSNPDNQQNDNNGMVDQTPEESDSTRGRYPSAIIE